MVYQTCSTHILPETAQKNYPTLNHGSKLKKKYCKGKTDIGENYEFDDDKGM